MRGRHLTAVATASLVVSLWSHAAHATSSLGRVVHGYLLTYAQSTHEGFGGVVAYGSAVTRAQLGAFGPPNPSSTSCLGTRCFGLGTVKGFEYPLASTDHGATWRNAGHWFAGGWADGAAFASTITMFSATTAVAWYPGQNTFYVTSDAGHNWYAAWPLGKIVAVTSPNEGATLVMHVLPYSTAPTKVVLEYRSIDDGRQWIRVT